MNEMNGKEAIKFIDKWMADMNPTEPPMTLPFNRWQLIRSYITALEDLAEYAKLLEANIHQKSTGTFCISWIPEFRVDGFRDALAKLEERGKTNGTII